MQRALPAPLDSIAPRPLPRRFSVLRALLAQSRTRRRFRRARRATTLSLATPASPARLHRSPPRVPSAFTARAAAPARLRAARARARAWATRTRKMPSVTLSAMATLSRARRASRPPLGRTLQLRSSTRGRSTIIIPWLATFAAAARPRRSPARSRSPSRRPRRTRTAQTARSPCT